MTPAETLRAELILESRFENIEVAERALLDLCAHVGCASDEQYWLVTALREAVANAIRHGNQLRPDRAVRVELDVVGDDFTVVVDDQGEGFDPSEVPDPTDPENLMRPSGRGIFYMRQFMTRVEFARSPGGGTRVVMARKLQNKESSR